MPKKSISEKASKVTRIQIRNDEMYANGVAVITVSPRQALMSFSYFLNLKIKKPCIHNGNTFDVPRILDLARSLNLMKELILFIKRLCDS